MRPFESTVSKQFFTCMTHQQTAPLLSVYTRQAPFDWDLCGASGPHYTLYLWPVGLKMTYTGMPLGLNKTHNALHNKGHVAT